jgi:hypothetical protein
MDWLDRKLLLVLASTLIFGFQSPGDHDHIQASASGSRTTTFH